MPSSLALHAFSKIVGDTKFIDSFIDDNRLTLREHYEFCTKILKAHSIPYIPSNAGFYIWTDLTKYLSSFPGKTERDKERAMATAFLDGGVFIASSEAYFGEDYGWFRITFTVDKDTLELGLKRLCPFN
jgi:1-aminocyclopropane-1-carboxylate synthase